MFKAVTELGLLLSHTNEMYDNLCLSMNYLIFQPWLLDSQIAVYWYALIIPPACDRLFWICINPRGLGRLLVYSVGRLICSVALVDNSWVPPHQNSQYTVYGMNAVHRVFLQVSLRRGSSRGYARRRGRVCKDSVDVPWSSRLYQFWSQPGTPSSP